MDRQQTADDRQQKNDRQQNPAACRLSSASFKMDDVQEDNIVPQPNLRPRFVVAVVAGLIATMVVLVIRIANPPPEPTGPEVVSDVVYLDDETFAEQTASGLVLVDFYTDWCGPCQMMAPAIESVATRYKGKAVVAKVNGDYGRLAYQFRVEAYPTVVLLKDGQEVIRVMGLQTEPELVLLLETAINQQL